MGQNNVIVINGKRYDAKTGRLMADNTTTSQPTAKSHAKPSNGVMLDGFARRPARKPAAVESSHAIHKKTERSKTLMRTAVKKPAVHKVHATSTASHAVKTVRSPIAPRVHTDENRLHRAASATKSSLISKFGSVSETIANASHTITHLPVAPAPVATKRQNHEAAVAPQSHKSPFQSVIEQAISHEQQGPAKTTRRERLARRLRISPRAVSISSMMLAGILLGGFFVYQNIPNLAMRVAAARSGVQASLPGYKPAGFAMNGPIKYSPGQITVTYRAATDDRKFQVTQKNSEWNSETLLESFVAVDRRPYQTYQDKGKTIYIYEGSNATWVDSGVWYNIEGSSSLSSDQLLRLANSL